MATTTSRNSKKNDGGLSSLSPRQISVEKFTEARAAELESLHSVISNRLNKDFRSKRNQRRRTNAFTNQPGKKRRNPKRPRSESSIGQASGGGDHETKIPRRVKRRMELKGNPESGFYTSGDGTKRLRTHVWHAKRFSMTKLWGFHIPLGLHGRGKGSRDVLKKSRQGVLVHDASYHIAVQLEGPEGSLLSILNKLLEPSPSSHSKEALDSILTGRSYGNAMLYHVEPPVSQVVAPVTYMWRPSQLPMRRDEGKGGDCVGNDGPVSNGDYVDFRKLWVWIHASSFSEGYASLKQACQRQMNETGVLVGCSSLEGQLAKLEIFGSKASHLLQKTLHPVKISSSEDSSILRKCSTEKAEVKNVADPYKEENISSCAILPLFVMDPRLITNDPLDDSTVSVEMTKTEPLEITTNTEAESSPEVFKCLWDTNSELTPPEDENILCWEKHQSRLNSLCIDDPAAEVPKISSRPRSSRSCPLLLLKHRKHGNAPTGWSLILPLSWIKVFWNALVSKGAQAIGQREKRWLSCDAGLPFFPSDFPDCKAYSSLTMSEAAEMVEKAQRRPPAVRPFRIPIPPPWNSIHVTRSVGESSNQKLTSDGTTGVGISSYGGNLYDGIVARTSDSLNTFLQTYASDSLLLSPHNTSKLNANLMKTLQEDETKAIAQIHQSSNKLCLVRVLLHAFKEGSFEDGAVVCAPTLADISLLKSGCNEGEKGRVTIPQSSVTSYFQEQHSGTWELNVPEDTQSHRWPIGFVTTGFVRGSKKLTAEALCDAVLLGRLREEQWREKDVKRRKKEIYVLVRNLRSCAYRLALATIVLEQQEGSIDDVHCL